MSASREEIISNTLNRLSVFILGMLVVLSTAQIVSICRKYRAVNFDLYMDAGNVYVLLAQILSLFLYIFGCIKGAEGELSALNTGRILSALFLIKGISSIINVGAFNYAYLTGLFIFRAVCFLAASCSAFILFCKGKRSLVLVIILYAVAVRGIIQATTNGNFSLEIIQDNSISWDDIFAMGRSLASLFLYIWTMLQVSLLIRREHIVKEISLHDGASPELRYHIILALLHCCNVLTVMLIFGPDILPGQLSELCYLLFTFAFSSGYYILYGFPLTAAVGLLFSAYHIWRASGLRKIPYILWGALSILELFAYCFLFFVLSRQ